MPTTEPVGPRQSINPSSVAALMKAVSVSPINLWNFMTVSAILQHRGLDLRLDLFRGLANWATAFVYARRTATQGLLAGSALLMRRAWQLYVARALRFVFYTATIGYVAQRYGKSHLLDEFNAARLIEQRVARSPGAWAALGGGTRVHALARSRTVLAASVGLRCLRFCRDAGSPLRYGSFKPVGLLGLFVPNDKTNLAPYRARHFLPFAVIMVRLVPENWAGLRFPSCGRWSSVANGLEVFVGIFLSFVGQFILAMYSDRLVTQIAVSAAGLISMTCAAFNGHGRVLCHAGVASKAGGHRRR